MRWRCVGRSASKIFALHLWNVFENIVVPCFALSDKLVAFRAWKETNYNSQQQQTVVCIAANCVRLFLQLQHNCWFQWHDGNVFTSCVVFHSQCFFIKQIILEQFLFVNNNNLICWECFTVKIMKANGISWDKMFNGRWYVHQKSMWWNVMNSKRSLKDIFVCESKIV